MVAVIEFHGRRIESTEPGGPARVYNPGDDNTFFRFGSGSVPDRMVQAIYRDVCRAVGTGTAGEYTWHRLD